MTAHPDSTRYLKTFAAIVALLVVAAVAINLVIDPYGIAQLVSLERFNEAKPREWENARLAKPFDIARQHYEGIILGTSQVERGIDPGYPALSARGVPLYNMGLSELRLYEAAMLLDYSAAKSRVSYALISLDFLRYNRPPEDPKASLPENWSSSRLVRDYLRTLVSARGLTDSVTTFRGNRSGAAALQHLPQGMLNVEQFFARTGLPDVRGSFDSVDAAYLNSAYDRMRSEAQTLARSGFDHAGLKRILALGRERRIQLYFFIPPSHAREMEVMEFLGLTPLFDQWKSELACVLATEAAGTPAAAAFPLWDFSGYNSITTEAVPAKGNAAARMKWFFDPIHFTPAAGNLILNRVLDLKDSAAAPFGDFGIQLTPPTTGAHANSIHAARMRYIQQHPEIPQVIADLHTGPAPSRGNNAGDDRRPRDCSR